MKLSVDKRAKGLIFDLDGTLIDSMPIHFEAWKATFKKHGGDYSLEEFYRNAGIPAKETVEILNTRFGYSHDPVSFAEEKEAMYIALMHEAAPIMPCVDIVKEYYGVIPMSVGTGGYHDVALENIKNLGLEKELSILVAADDVTQHKPHPETFLKAAELMGIEPQYCQVFEDGDLGIDAAKAGGMIATDIRPFI